MSKKISLKETARQNGFESINEMLETVGLDSVVPACCDEGCEVEPDGKCEHDNPSILLELGVI